MALMNKTSYPCSICNKGNIANYWCTDCSDGLCDTCSSYHTIPMPVTHHKIIPLDEVHNDLILKKSQTKTHCKKHPQEVEDVCCSKDKIFCCHVCALVINMQCKDDHQPEEQSEFTEEIRQQKLDTANRLQFTIRHLIAKEKAVIEKATQASSEFISELEDKVDMCKDGLDNLVKEESEIYLKALKNKTTAREESMLDVNLEKHVDELDIANNISSNGQGIDVHKHFEQIEEKVGKTYDSFTKEIRKMQIEKFVKKIAPENLLGSQHDLDVQKFAIHCRKTLKTLGRQPPLAIQGNVPEAAGKNTFLSENVTLEAVLNRHVINPRDSIYDATYLPDNTLLLCDHGNKQLTKINLNFSIVATLPVDGKPTGVCHNSACHHIYVSCNEKVLIYTVQGSWKEISRFRTERHNWGITCHEKKIISGHLFGVIIYDITGKELNRICNAKCSIYPAVSKDGSLLFYCDDNDVVCRRMEDVTKDVWRYSSKKLVNPFSLDIDNDGNVLITGYESRNIFQVSEDGKCSRVLVHKLSHITRASGIFYNKNMDIIGVVTSSLEGCALAEFYKLDNIANCTF